MDNKVIKRAEFEKDSARDTDFWHQRAKQTHPHDFPLSQGPLQSHSSLVLHEQAKCVAEKNNVNDISADKYERC